MAHNSFIAISPKRVKKGCRSSISAERILQPLQKYFARNVYWWTKTHSRVRSSSNFEDQERAHRQKIGTNFFNSSHKLWRYWLFRTNGLADNLHNRTTANHAIFGCIYHVIVCGERSFSKDCFPTFSLSHPSCRAMRKTCDRSFSISLRDVDVKLQLHIPRSFCDFIRTRLEARRIMTTFNTKSEYRFQE